MTNSIDKAEIIGRTAKAAGVSHQEALKVVNELFEQVQAAVAAGDRVTFVGFGRFGARESAARTVRNPNNNEQVPVAEKTVPTFKFGGPFKDRVAEAGAVRRGQ